jgi:hypothetical protein
VQKSRRMLFITTRGGLFGIFWEALIILLFHKNKTIFPARIAPDFVIGLGNTQSIPCARCLV